MSKVRLYGSTSGYIELAAPAVAPDTTITLPSTAGAFGGLVAVQQAVKTDTQTSSSIANGASVAVSGLSITHSLSAASNKLIISVYIGTWQESALTRGALGLLVKDGATVINAGDAASNRTSVTVGGPYSASGVGAGVSGPSATFLYTPGDTTSRTYTVEVVNLTNTTTTIYVNRSSDDTDVVYFPRSSSALVIQEVAV
jgi:hypothetical protein